MDGKILFYYSTSIFFLFNLQVFSGGRFEGISWNLDETVVAYVAEEPDRPRPTFNGVGSWKGEGDWEEDWGETYAGKRQPALFVINVDR